MKRRKTKSGGQAIVLVTLALFAMAGLMGLAVDLGYSFFVEKQAQAAADAAALGAVQEAVLRIRAGGGTVTGFTCASAGTGSTQVDCEAPISCKSVTATSNLNNGCQYALKNGFNWTTASRQNVTLESSDISTKAPPTAPGVKNISYWVTARTVQTIPQLFSAMTGNRTGIVSAIATAAIAGSIAPGSFYGMNHKGDCTNATTGTYCGEDLVTGTGGGNGKTTVCPSNPNANGSICAPAGLILSSSCNTKQNGVCDGGVAGDASKGSGVEGSSLTVMSGGALSPTTPSGQWHDANSNPLTPTYSSDPKTFQDPFAGNPQPGLQSSSALPSCGIPSGTINGGGKTPVVLKAYQYYAYKFKDASNRPIPSGDPIIISGNVQFDATSGASCASLGGYEQGGATQDSHFPTYIFYGGMRQSGTTYFGAGQYVFAGVKSGGSTVFYSDGSGNGSITGDTATGTMFIFTDTNYPQLNTQIANVPNNGSFPAMTQGSLDFKNANITLSGLVSSHVSGSNLPAGMDVYSGVAWWQDRRNSTVGYNKTAGSAGCFGSECTGDDGKVIYCALASECADGPTHLAGMLAANHVTSTSPGVLLDPGNANLNLTGVYYQPRGAWLEVKHGTAGGGGGFGNLSLQIVTGALIQDTGDTTLLLKGPTNPIQQFKATLIQ